MDRFKLIDKQKIQINRQIVRFKLINRQIDSNIRQGRLFSTDKKAKMPQQSLFQPITITRALPQQMNRVVNQFMLQVRQSLAQIIVSLQSDQLLQQMRNDLTLYQQKMTYIQQLIQTHFTPQPINSKLTRSLQSAHQKYQLMETDLEQTSRRITQLENKLQQSKDEYISQLNNIELQYKQFLVEKQTQQQQMAKTLLQKQQTLTKQMHQIHSLNIQLNKLKSTHQKQVQFLHQKLLTQNKLLHQADTQLKLYQENRELKQRQDNGMEEQNIQKQEEGQQNKKVTSLETRIVQLQTQITVLKQQLSTKEQHSLQLSQSLSELHHHQEQYRLTIQQMKQHMFTIKQQWQKKCELIEEELSQQYDERLIKMEEEMRQKLSVYANEMGEGKAVVIQSSEQVMESKRLVIERNYHQRIKQIQQHYHNQLKHYIEQTQTAQNQLQSEHQQLKQLQHQLQETLSHSQSMQSQWTHKQQQLKHTIANLEQTLSQTQLSHVNLQREVNTKHSQLKLQSDKQIQRLRKTQVMLLKDLKQNKLQKQQIIKQLANLKNQLITIRHTLHHQTTQLKSLQSINSTQHTKILELKKDLAIMNQKSILDQRSIKDKNQQIFRLENNINQLQISNKQIDNHKKILNAKLTQSILKSQENSKLKNQITHKLEKAYLLLRKLAKELLIVKQDIQFQINSQKTKLQTISMQFSQELALRQDSIKYNYKLKTQQLLEQVQNQKTQQRRQLEEIIRENNNMKKQIKLLEQVITEKDQDHIYQKQRLVSLQVEKCRVFMQQEVEREKEEKRRLEQKLYNQQKKHDYLMTKAEKQVYKTIKLFISKWQNKLASSQQALQASQATAKQLTRQLKITDAEINDLHNEIKQKDEKLTKLQKKYQMLKQQRDKTVDEMMRRLQKQTKHKLSLEREMKQVRGQVMKTQPYITSNNSPFNNYSFTDRQNAIVYTNAFQPTTHEKPTKTQIKPTNRQKELSQIREMIAKTYKVVQGPEKGSPLHKGKLF